MTISQRRLISIPTKFPTYFPPNRFALWSKEHVGIGEQWCKLPLRRIHPLRVERQCSLSDLVLDLSDPLLFSLSSMLSHLLRQQCTFLRKVRQESVSAVS